MAAILLARVKKGEHVVITERGQAIAHLSPIVPAPLAELVAAGRVKPPSIFGTLPVPSGPVRDDREAGELLQRMREEERF